jgi:hypothetical protein
MSSSPHHPQAHNTVVLHEPQHCRPRVVPEFASMHHFLLEHTSSLISMLMYASLQCWCGNVLALVLLGAMANLLLGYCVFFYVILGIQILNLICYIITLLWYATHCYIAFVLLHCFDILHCHIALICYILLHLFYSATFLSIWIHTTMLNDESGLGEMSVVIWTNIILLRFQLWTT